MGSFDTCGRKREVQRCWVGKRERVFGKPRSKWEDCIKRVIKKHSEKTRTG